MKNFKKEVKRKVFKRIKYVFPCFDDGIKHFVDPELVLDYEFAHKGIGLSHVAHYKKHGNCGDILLPRMVRDVFAHFQEEHYEWDGYHVSQAVCDKVADSMHKKHGMVIGGGGLFLRDTSKNSFSGWQWACSTTRVLSMKKPIVLFGVGYNRFRGQKDFSKKFRGNLKALAQRSVYFGLRNSGSIEAIKQYLPEEYHYKLRYQPCPTTLSASLYPELIEKARAEHKDSKVVAFNYAHDRIAMRLGNEKKAILNVLVERFKSLVKDGYELHFYAHHHRDEKFLPYLEKADVPYTLVKLYKMTPIAILEAYTKPALALGMRGHAQMIPFGCATPVISLISHDKLAWFLKDIKHEEWGVEMRDVDFAKELATKVDYFLKNRDTIHAQIMETQSELMAITKTNVEDFIQEVEKF